MKQRAPIKKVSAKRLKLMEEGAVDRRTGFKKPTLESLKLKKLAAVDKLLAGPFLTTAKEMVSKPKIRKKIRVRAKPKPGQQTQVGLFEEIWTERPHFSEVSGDPLFERPEDPQDRDGMRLWLSQFSHILNKGHYRAFKSIKTNIVLKTPKEHALWERHKKQSPYHCEPQYREGWSRIVDICIRLEREANHLITI